MSASRVVAAVVALAAGTHALALACAAHVRGSLSLLALACAGLALALGGRATSRRVAAVGLVALAFLLFPREAAFTSAGDLLVLALNRSPGASGTAIAGGAAVLAGMVAALVRSRASRRAAVAGLAAAIAFAAMGVGTAAREIGATRPARAEARRFLARLDSVPPMTAGAGLDIVVNAPGGTDAVARARPSRPFARAPEALGTGFALRLLKWAPPADDGLLAMLPPDLFPVDRGDVDPGIRLLAPADGATLAARSAEDEPEFRFVPGAVAHDHGDCCHGGLKVIILSSEGTRTRVIVARPRRGDRAPRGHARRAGCSSGAGLAAHGLPRARAPLGGRRRVFPAGVTSGGRSPSPTRPARASRRSDAGSCSPERASDREP